MGAGGDKARGRDGTAPPNPQADAAPANPQEDDHSTATQTAKETYVTAKETQLTLDPSCQGVFKDGGSALTVGPLGPVGSMWTKPITVITPTSFSVPGEKPANVHGIPDEDFVFQNGVWEAKMYPCDPRDPPWTRSYSRVTVKEEVKEQLRKRLSEYPLFQVCV